MGNVLKKVGIGIIIIIGILLIIILIIFIINKIKLKQESNLFRPLGKMVTVNK